MENPVVSGELSDCIILPCRVGPVYFRRSAITAIFPRGTGYCLVQTIGDCSVDDHTAVEMPALDVAEKVFGKLA